MCSDFVFFLDNEFVVLCVHVGGGWERGGGTHIARSVGALYVLICVLLDDEFIVHVGGGCGGGGLHVCMSCWVVFQL